MTSLNSARRYFKYILTKSINTSETKFYFHLGYVRLHLHLLPKDLRESRYRSHIVGGGYFAFNVDLKKLVLYGSSIDFGKIDYKIGLSLTEKYSEDILTQLWYLLVSLRKINSDDIDFMNNWVIEYRTEESFNPNGQSGWEYTN